MSEPFRVAQPTEEAILDAPVIPKETEGVVKGDNPKEPTSEKVPLEVWEFENKSKVLAQEFGIKNIAETFEAKMNIGKIDKYIKGQMEERGYDKNVENYKSVLAELEGEIDSKRLSPFLRMNKIINLIGILTRKSNEEKKLKELKSWQILSTK